MRCDFQKSECHFQSRSCSLYSFKATDKILKRGKGGGVLTVTNVHIPYVGGEGQKPLLHYLGASVCSYSRDKKDRQIQYLAPEKIYVTQNLELGGPVELLPSQHAQTHRHLWSRTSP